ncbi:MAG TPA: DUF4337 domain-containing protein [Chthonomonadaceae bacterium]|nr:DUF4337 domain-containing protein [Chthonomonadaceae bacterium]
MPEEAEIETKELQETIDELREERAEREKEVRESSWTKWVSLSTALLAVVAAIAALQSGNLVNEALIVKNDAVLKQAQASDTWNYYQAKGIEGYGAAQMVDQLSTHPAQAAVSAKYQKDVARYKQKQKQLYDQATKLEQERDKENTESGEFLEQHHIFAYCVTFTQVAIALSAVAALTKRKPVWYISLLIGLIGLALLIYGYVPKPHAAEARSAQASSKAAE